MLLTYLVDQSVHCQYKNYTFIHIPVVMNSIIKTHVTHNIHNYMTGFHNNHNYKIQRKYFYVIYM